MFKHFAGFLVKRPVKVIFAALVLIVIFTAGVANIRLATGNNTLIEPETNVYQNNLALEREFGGESIVVLFEGEGLQQLLTAHNLGVLQQLENRLQGDEHVFSVISPATIFEQMAGKQYEQYHNGIGEVAGGLQVMGGKLHEIAANVSSNAAAQPSLIDLESQIASLDEGFSGIIQGQQKLQQGTINLVNGYAGFGTQLTGAAASLQQLSTALPDLPGAAGQQPSEQVKRLGAQLQQVSEQMHGIAENSAALPMVPENTIKGLKTMQGNLTSKLAQLSGMQDGQKQQLSNLQQLGEGLSTMGDNLLTISTNLTTMLTYADAVAPSVPTSQGTIDRMAYDDDGNLRVMFTELIVDESHMLMMIKLQGDTDDAAKNSVLTLINDFVDSHPLEAVETIVTGKPVLDSAIRSSMQQSMQQMMGLSVIFMVLVLLLTFRVRWRLLPLAAILVAVIGTVGLMGWLRIPVTMVSMAVFPILIGLGIDYSIQFQSRYAEEMEAN